jgi:hypothetical protein
MGIRESVLKKKEKTPHLTEDKCVGNTVTRRVCTVEEIKKLHTAGDEPRQREGEHVIDHLPHVVVYRQKTMLSTGVNNPVYRDFRHL